MAVRAQCPQCGTVLDVADTAPMILTCPRCLANIQRPSPGPPPLPVADASLDQEAMSDTRIARTAIFVIAAMAVLGVIMLFAVSGANQNRPHTVLAVLAFAVLAAVFLNFMRDSKHPPTTPLIEIPILAPEAQTPVLLDYSSIHRGDNEPVKTWRWGAATSGFFAAIGICAAGFFILAETIQSTSGVGLAYLATIGASIVVFCIMAARLNKRSGMYGFGQGAALGMVLGMLALGPCAFCYLITLK